MAYGVIISARQARAEEHTMTHKTKQAALKAAREALGDEAIESVDFNITNTGAGWTYVEIPPTNEPAAEAQGARLKLVPTSEDPLVVDGKRFPNASRANEARRLLDQKAHAKAEAAVADDPPKHAPRKAAAAAKAPAAPKGPKKAATPKPAQEGKTKSDTLMEMLTTAGGATSKEMEDATGWQPHSVRGFLGTLRKKGVEVIAKKLPKEPTIYRVAKKHSASAAAQVGDVV